MLNSSIITAALRDIGIVRPTLPQTTIGLEKLEGLIVGLSDGVMGGSWVDQDITSDVTAEENDRLRVTTADPVTISLPVTTTYRERTVDVCGCITIEMTCDESRAPRDGAKVLITDVYQTITPQLYFYRADRGDWVRANGLEYGGECPLGEQYRRGLTAMLSEDLTATYPVEIPPVVARNAAQGRLQLAGRFSAPRQPTQAEYF